MICEVEVVSGFEKDKSVKVLFCGKVFNPLLYGITLKIFVNLLENYLVMLANEFFCLIGLLAYLNLAVISMQIYVFMLWFILLDLSVY